MIHVHTSDEFIGLFVAAVLCGFFLQSSFQCIRAFVRQKQKQWITYSVATTLYALVALDMSLAVIRLSRVLQCCPSQGGNCTFHVIPWYNLVKTSTVALSSLLVEGILIYRCWFVYLRRWAAVVIPILLWFSGLAMIAYTIYVQSKLERQKLHSQWKAEELVHTVFWALTMLMNAMTTMLIVLRILQVESNSKGNYSKIKAVCQPETQLQSVVQTVVGSGLMCTVASLFVFVSRIAGSRSSAPASSMMIMVSAISFNLMITRAGKHARKENRALVKSTRVSNLIFMTNTLKAATRTTAQISSSFGKESVGTSDSLILSRCPVAHLNIERYPYCPVLRSGPEVLSYSAVECFSTDSNV